MVHFCTQICVALQWCLSGSWELYSFGSLGKTFSVTHNPRTLFHKGFGYIKACHQDLPKPPSEIQQQGASCKPSALVWAPQLGRSVPWAPHGAELTARHLQWCWQEQAAWLWRVPSSSAVSGQGGGLPLSASLLEVAFTATPLDSFFSGNLNSSSRQGSLLPQEG